MRAFTLLATDRPGLTLEAWLDEAATLVPKRDRLLDSDCGDALPRRGLAGLTAPTGCLFAVFAYTVDAGADGRDVLFVRGPSWSAPMGGQLVVDALEAMIVRLAADLGCEETRRTPW